MLSTELFAGVDLRLCCDARGRVLAVDTTDARLREALHEGGALAPMVSEASAMAVLDFLFRLRQRGASWLADLRLSDAAGGGAMHLLGYLEGTGLQLVGSRSLDRLRLLLTELVGLTEPGPGDGLEGIHEPTPSGTALRELLAELGLVGLAPGLDDLRALLAQRQREVAELQAALDQLESRPSSQPRPS